MPAIELLLVDKILRNKWGPILLVSCFCIFSHCTTTIHRSLTQLDFNTNGLGFVGFGFFIYQPSEKNLANLILSTTGTLYLAPESVRITLEEVINLDENSKTMETKPLPLVEYKLESEGKIGYKETYLSCPGVFYHFVPPNPNSTYIITEISYSFKKAGGRGTLLEPTRKFPIDPFHSYQSLPIRVTSGNLEFLGTYMASILKTSDSDPYGVDDPNPGYSEIFQRAKVTPKIQDAESFIQNRRLDDLRNRFYGNLKLSKKSMQIRFLMEILEYYSGTLWASLAQSKLDELSLGD